MSFAQGVPSVNTLINSSNTQVFGNTSTGTALSVQQLGSGSVMNVATSTGTSALFVTSAGNVGVGTASPGQLFEVSGGSAGVGAISAYSGYFLGINEAQWLSINTSTPLIRTPAGAGVWIYKGPSNNQVDLQFMSVASVGTPSERMRITTAGNVGIGVTNPGAQLQIGGTNVTGNVLQIGNFTFQMVSYQGLFGTGTVTYTPVGNGIFVAYFAGDVLIFSSTNTAGVGGQYSSTISYLNAGSLTGNVGLGQLSLSTAQNGVLTATYKNSGDYMRVFRMAF